MGRSAHADRIRAPSKLILLLFICLTAFVPVLPLPDKAPGCDVVKDQWQDLCARGSASRGRTEGVGKRVLRACAPLLLDAIRGLRA